MKAIFRRYTVANEPGREVVLTISTPKRWRKDWACRLNIEGLPNARELVPGADPVQAVLLALESARIMLDASGLPLVWLEGGVPGDVGIPKFVPTTYGFEMQRKWERYLDRETTRADHAVSAFIKERMRTQEARKRRSKARSEKPKGSDGGE